ncbi:MAG: bifunctional UDP-sugar hydrolase/5'-nucleotidase [Syntrophobacteraceae bacterium]|nr:bifunctional UDP-sugar hydrolase/5'-nucleotidase [Syntrophobacteraceae bacterium]
MRIPHGFRRGVLAGSTAALLIFLSVLLPPVIPGAFAGRSQNPVVSLTILHVNDTHGHIVPFSPFVGKILDHGRKVGGAAYLATMIETQRAKNPQGTILLSAGDMFQGTPESNVFHGKPVVEIMNYLHFDAMALGNHEFDWGQGVLHSIISWASFPVISANITTPEGGPIEGVKPYIILQRKGVRIAVIGLTTPTTRYTTKPENVADLTFSSPSSVMPSLIREVRAKGASIVIALTHLGLNSDEQLAGQVRGIDLIVGGHSHTVVMDPVVESGTVIVQAGSYGRYLGVMKISFDPETKKILTFTRQNELVAVSPQAAPPDPEVARIVDKYEAKIQAEFSKTIGTAAVDLRRDSAEESNLGDLIADAMRDASGAQIAFENNGGIRDNIPAGPITLNEVFTTLPFDDNIVSMTLSGKQVREAIERSAAYGRISLQVSGIQIVFDLSKPPGERAVSIKVGGKPLDEGATYRVATNDFLASGGDRFEVFKQGRDISTGQSLRDAVAQYIGNNSPVKTGGAGRIILREGGGSH